MFINVLIFPNKKYIVLLVFILLCIMCPFSQAGLSIFSLSPFLLFNYDMPWCSFFFVSYAWVLLESQKILLNLRFVGL